MSEKKQHQAQINITSKSNGMRVDWEYITLAMETDGKYTYSCVIPAFGIYFDAKNREDIDRKSEALTEGFFDHFLDHSEKHGFRRFILQLHKLGFETPGSNLTIKELLNHKIHDAKFNSAKNIIPQGYGTAETHINKANLEIAL